MDVTPYIKAQKDFFFFCKEILGYKRNDEFELKDLALEHEELCRLLQDGGNKSKLILMPRYSFKSGICTAGYALWRLVKNPNLRVLIYSDSASKAQGFLQDIKNHIEGKAPNSKFRDFYPRWETDPHKGKWNESEIVVSTRTAGIREPSVDTGGIESTKVGKHYDLIIFDDIVSDVNVTTKAQMDKVHDCYKKALSLLKPGGEVVMVGTRWHDADTYGRIISENEERDNFIIFIKDAEEERNGKLIFEDIGLTREFLERQKQDQGSYIFSCLYRNSPVDDGTSLFKSTDFKFYQQTPDTHKNMYITGSCDPAGEGEDFTAITVVGTDKDRRMFLLDAVFDHMKPTQIMQNIIRLNYRWGFDRFVMEKNYFKGTFEPEFRKVQAEHLKNKHYKSFSFKEDLISSSAQRNHVRVLALQPYHERGAILFPGKDLVSLNKVFGELAFQMMRFTPSGSKSPHDDLLMSLAFHTEILIPGGEEESSKLPETSAAWFENMYIESLQRNKSPSARKQLQLIMN